MQQQFARGLGLVILEIAVRILVNVRVVQKDLVVLHAREGVADLAFAGAQRLDLGAVQDDARLEGLEDVIVAPGFRVGHNVSHGRMTLSSLRGLQIRKSLRPRLSAESEPPEGCSSGRRQDVMRRSFPG